MLVERPEERRERLAGPGRRHDQGVGAGRDRLPGAELGRRRRLERVAEPGPRHRREHAQLRRRRWTFPHHPTSLPDATDTPTIRPFWSYHPAVLVLPAFGPAGCGPTALVGWAKLPDPQVGRGGLARQPGRMVGPDWPDGWARLAGWLGQTGRMVARGCRRRRTATRSCRRRWCEDGAVGVQQVAVADVGEAEEDRDAERRWRPPARTGCCGETLDPRQAVAGHERRSTATGPRPAMRGTPSSGTSCHMPGAAVLV